MTVSHDRYFLDRVVDRLLVFEGGGNVSRFQGSYSEYMEKQKENSRQKPASEAAEPVKPEKRKGRNCLIKISWNGTASKTESPLWKKSINGEEEIAAAGSDFAKIQTLMEEQAQTAEELEAAMERWTELSLLIEELEQS